MLLLTNPRYKNRHILAKIISYLGICCNSFPCNPHNPLAQSKASRPVKSKRFNASTHFEFKIAVLRAPCHIPQTPSLPIPGIKIDTWMVDKLQQSIHTVLIHCIHSWSPPNIVRGVDIGKTVVCQEQLDSLSVASLLESKLGGKKRG